MANVASRQSFGLALAELGATNPDIVVMDADLSKSTMSCHFAEKFPERFYEFGIAEANMIGAAAGMALSGKVPFICSFACFITGRFDTIRMSIGYSQANVKIIGTHAGIGIGEDGHSQMGLEDLGLMRSIPGFVVLQPGDDIETRQAVQFAAEHNGPVYLRLTRQKLDQVNGDDYTFEMGKGVTLADGKDMTLIATGGTVGYAVKAKERLASKGIDARVLNIHTIKPIDEELIVKCAKETGCLMTIEDHSVIGGLGSSVAEVVAEKAPAKLKRWGILDEFGQSGTQVDLYRAYRIDDEGIAAVAEEFYKEAK
ncbi:MAG: transketolase C-terminal domain-containing protein [Candidatus Hinthialibacter antarcticus]|nr:transketolase C-terminal domain-containing protein [Candidatus Hinthialibacter antarcticus]